jgi:hypothetical protein
LPGELELSRAASNAIKNTIKNSTAVAIKIGFAFFLVMLKTL